MARRGTGVSLTLIRSRIGRRVALLFVLCGLVPLVVLAAITISSFAAKQRQQEERQLTALAKESAMYGLGRLLDAEERLRVADLYDDGAARARIPGLLSVALYDRDGRDAATGAAGPVVLAPEMRARLGNGEGALRLPDRPSQPALLVVPASGDARRARAWIGATIDLAALWALDEASLDERGSRRICLTSAGITLACTHGAGGADAAPADASGGRFSGVFTSTTGGTDLMGAYWAAPLRTHYGLTELTGVVTMPAAEATASSRDLLRTVALVTAAALCLALLVSFRQIRRLLDPLERLEAATTRLAHGDYQARVDVRTGDEIQRLGEAFNAMAGDIQRQFEQLHALSVGTLEALARAIDAKSPWTAGHSTRVAHLSVAIARTLGFDEPALQRIWRGSLLHDIGKIGLSADILDKPGPLSHVEMALVREHPSVGARILEPLPHCADILPIVLQHHERLDGRGYPAGLAGDAIALDARIVAVADVYDAMTSRRPYRDGVDPRNAVAYLREGRGSHFDGAVVDAFVLSLERDGVPAGAIPMPESAVPDELIA